MVNIQVVFVVIVHLSSGGRSRVQPHGCDPFGLHEFTGNTSRRPVLPDDLCGGDGEDLADMPPVESRPGVAG
ncbi:MAG: hypothetical protein KDA36_12590 [Planctomycetaceae bacterium]|nr:hypothetical protein [Planctomycetaceae bacterium]